MPESLKSLLWSNERQALVDISNPLWRAWLEHLRACSQCRTGRRCGSGQDMFDAAERQGDAYEQG